MVRTIVSRLVAYNSLHTSLAVTAHVRRQIMRRSPDRNAVLLSPCLWLCVDVLSASINGSGCTPVYNSRKGTILQGDRGVKQTKVYEERLTYKRRESC